MKKIAYVLSAMAMFALVSQVFAHGVAKGKNKPWAPRKDCSGVYGTKTKAKVTQVTLSQLFKNPAKYQGKMVQVKGKVKAACKFKGCWMMLVDGKHKMRVRFKGYGFFVPTNSAGYGAVAVGLAKQRTISVKMQRHYAKDAGKSGKHITKAKTVIAFTAHWVTLHKLKKGAKKKG